ncbi:MULTISPECIES: MlaD family protein [Acetobacter]|jgi:phospholipid/cholesterol/gamma-HCH transport system substrate-binding protein|uniref:Mce/MlaD domain-containing protein n=1 Tax=Acetobacter peroxydans TaxID=104098 RepID=A0A4Y3TRA8_9PROT|nr:MlaD family protein [Acetobacter peroxydans]MCH4093621.1 MlaD family protein [Acetobacter peroxydans]MCH4142390.1 MlaD family protein [Acetobacter peroxydans]MCI1394477.1 MlaD family protein [Acetobacter peroxydans]MCI1410328.1 MlaD family protein [Acetobacter peroxydans]MCI1438960.1 MlaD family protein [Acetobacter peroxydans]
MFQLRLRQKVKPLVSIRYADEWVGFLVLLSLVIFAGSVVEAGILRDWLTPPAHLRVVLPESGVGGLTVGGDVQLMGAHAGTIRSIKLNPSGSMYANVDLDPQVKPFIRRDSTALIRKQLIVTGASYLDLSRGAGEPMDWSYAVIKATPAPNPADQITATFESIQGEIMPALASARHMMAELDSTITDMHAGKGTVGRLMTNDELIRQAEATIASLDEVITRLRPIEQQISSVMKKTDATMANVQSASGDVKAATPHVKTIASNLDESMADLPALLAQAQTTLYGLEKLTDQLRGMWLLGGHKVSRHNRLDPEHIQP